MEELTAELEVVNTEKEAMVEDCAMAREEREDVRGRAERSEDRRRTHLSFYTPFLRTDHLPRPPAIVPYSAYHPVSIANSAERTLCRAWHVRAA